MKIYKNKFLKKVLDIVYPQKFKMYLLMIMIIFSVSSCVLIWSYIQARNQVYNISKDLVTKRVSENVDLLDQNLKNFQYTLFSLAIDDNIFWLKNWNEYTDTKRLNYYNSASKRMRNILLPDPYILDLYACFPSQGIVISDGLYKIEDYKIIPQSQWQNLKTNKLNLFIKSALNQDGNVDIESVFLAHKIGYDVNETGFLVMELTPSVITNILDNTINLGEESIYVSDKNGQLVFTTGKLSIEKWNMYIEMLKEINDGEIDLNSDSYFIAKEEISITGWTYNIAIPKNMLIRGQKFNINITLMISVILIMALIFSLLSTEIAFRPLEKIYQVVSRHSSRPAKSDRNMYLIRTYEKTFTENDNLRAEVLKNLPLIQDKVLMQTVFRADNNSDNKLNLQKVGIVFSKPYFRIVVTGLHINQIYSNTEKTIPVKVFKEFWEERLKERCECRIVLFEPQQFFIIINYENNMNYFLWKEYFNELLLLFKNEFFADLTVGISQQKSSLDELNIAFSEALLAFESQKITEPGIAEAYENLAQNKESDIIYPFEIVNQLANSLRASDTKSISNCLAELKSFLKLHPPKNEFFLHQIFLYMSGTLEKLLIGIEEKNQERNNVEPFMHVTGIDGHMRLFEKFTDQLYERYQHLVSNKCGKMFEEIVDYIMENYTQILTPDDIAEHFYISTAYLYRLMKTFSTITPKQLLTKLKVEEAARLLICSKMAINEVSFRCGFEKEQSFYRNFKKKYGCTPSQYRDSHV